MLLIEEEANCGNADEGKDTESEKIQIGNDGGFHGLFSFVLFIFVKDKSQHPKWMLAYTLDWV